MNYKSVIIILLTLTVLSSCKNYYIPIETFKNQFSDIDSTKLKKVRTRGPIGDIAEYLAIPIEQIKCLDKNGNEALLQNSPSIETRITTDNGKKTILYFDRIYMYRDTLIGFRSRFLGFQERIPLSKITKIEVQDGRKNFKYVE